MKYSHLAIVVILLVSACANNKAAKEEQSNEKTSNPVGCMPQASDKSWYSSGKKAPVFKGLDGIDFKISTHNNEVQKYFNQGMMLAYGFNHAEAARSFYEATRLDSNCAMAYWGYAYVLGPNYNGGMEDDNYERAYKAAVTAKQLSKTSTPKEAALVEALMARYTETVPADRSPLDIAYAAAMKKVYIQFSSDPDIGALYAESLMNLHPWDLYEKETQKPKSWTAELLSVLQQLMKTNPKHPGAHHFYIHAMEASATPEKALASAALLDTLVAGSGHLLHMSSHIYINTGDYHSGTLANIKAVEVDSIYTTACHAQGVYPLAYYPHNYHFLAATATLEGNKRLAWQAAKKMQENTPADIMRMPGWGTLQHYFTIPYYVAVKFAMWDSILALPSPASELVYPKAIWHYARGMAYAGKNNLVAAKKEIDSVNSLAADTTLAKLTIWDINTTSDLVQIAQKVLKAEIAAQQNHLDSSISLLKEAIIIEDNLNYNEPPDWFFSVRHYLGAQLLNAEKYKDAEKVYQQDLKKWRKNGWALKGLEQSLLLQKKNADAEKAKVAFNEAWKYADINIASSTGITN